MRVWGRCPPPLMGGPELDHLIAVFAKLPGLGQRSARRIVLRLLQNPQTRMVPLAQALAAAAAAVRPCARCGNLDSTDPCAICADQRRDPAMICVVETVADLWALERAGVNPGRYHVLGGVLSAVGGITPEDLSITPLLARLDSGSVSEIILALGATVDGATTAHYLTDRLRSWNITITRLGHGMPIGGALEVLDDGTLAAALKARRRV
jgi:recombination protein RecR